MKIKSLAELIGNEHSKVGDVINAIGRMDEKQRTRYRLIPTDRAFTSAYLGFDTDPTLGETPRYVELTLNPNTILRVSDLSEVFGKWHDVPPPPHGNPFVILYRYDRPTVRFLAFVYASLTGEPQKVDTRIEKITVRREERL